MYLYSVKDVKSGIFASPFVSENEKTASRALQTTLFTSQDSLLKIYPEDYILYQIASFDNESGLIQPHDLYRVASCNELIENYRQSEVDSSKFLKIDKKKTTCKK